MRVQELREQRASRVAEMQGLVAGAESAKRDLDGNEATRFESLKAEVRGLEGQIQRAETLQEFERRADAEPMGGFGGTGGMSEIERRFSVGKAVGEFMDRGRLTGAEAEWASEHRSQHSGFTVPVSCFLGGEQRYVGTQTPSGGPGGNLVQTSLGPLIERPRPTLAVQRLGATTLSGLRDNLDLPRVKSSGSAAWVAEHQEGPQVDPTFDKVSMGPHTVTGNYEMSRRMLIQAPEIEQILRADLGLLLAEQLDRIAVLGTGATGAPRGVIATPGVKKYAMQTAIPTNPTIAELDRVFAGMTGGVAAADIAGTTGFLSHPLVKSTLGKYRDGDGALIYPGGVPVLGERAEWSSQIPANAGANTDQATIIYGNWSDLVIGYWSAVDILLNPYADSIAKKGGALLHAFLDADVALRHPESFAFTDSFPVFRGSFTTVQ